MRIAIAGGHGQVAQRLGRVLSQRGHEVIGIIRHPEQRGDLEELGVSPRVLDLESAGADDIAEVIDGCDAVVFAAGAGPGSGAARKETVDYGAAVELIAAAQQAGVDRYVMVSAMGTDDPPDGDSVFEVYLRAKSRADNELMDSGLHWTIVRPGRLTDTPGTGRVELARHVERGEIPRDDVAAVLAECLERPETSGHVFEVVAGTVPVEDAVTAATA